MLSIQTNPYTGEPLNGENEVPTFHLRIYRGVLQQEFLSVLFENGLPTSTLFEWRDVPVIDEPEEEV